MPSWTALSIHYGAQESKSILLAPKLFSSSFTKAALWGKNCFVFYRNSIYVKAFTYFDYKTKEQNKKIKIIVRKFSNSLIKKSYFKKISVR